NNYTPRCSPREDAEEAAAPAIEAAKAVVPSSRMPGGCKAGGPWLVRHPTIALLGQRGAVAVGTRGARDEVRPQLWVCYRGSRSVPLRAAQQPGRRGDAQRPGQGGEGVGIIGERALADRDPLADTGTGFQTWGLRSYTRPQS